MANTVALIDYGAGNLHSVHNALKAVGAEVHVTADPRVVRDCTRIVLPGVGAFKTCMDGLDAIEGLPEALEGQVANGKPFLGICVGMQLMAEYGTEDCGDDGPHLGLGWVAGSVDKISVRDGVKIPHMGWNEVKPVGPESLIKEGEAYFLHSYAYSCSQTPSAVCAVTDHGGEVVAAIQSGSAIGVQFHPEKSQAYGLGLLKRFLAWRP